jgi:short-subunit dehydrogenase
MTAPLVFVTGASSGIGRALALAYARAGWRLFLVSRRAARLDQWVRASGLDPASVTTCSADVRLPESIVAAGQRCLAECGLPQVVIASAGISIGFDSAEFDDLAVMQETLQTNVLGMAATFQPFVAAMRAARRGTLVGIASVAAIRGLPGHGAYCASKAAVVNYCESLRVELHGQGVHVVTLLPGFIDTPLTRGNPYPMPFLMSADRFAARAVKAIAACRPRAVIPWPMALVARLLRLLPPALFDRLFAGRARKPRRRR